MKLLSYLDPNANVRIGALLKDGVEVADLQATCVRRNGSASPAFATMLALLEEGGAAMDDAARLVELAPDYGTTTPLADLRLLAPIPRPVSIRDCLGFMGHLVNSMRNIVAGGRLRALDEIAEQRIGRTLAQVLTPTAWERPLYYFSNVCGVVGGDTDVAWPPYTRHLDYELEWGVYIGTRGANIRASKARAHIAGYTIFNDVSARDVQMQEMKGRLGVQKGKFFDGSNVMGPWLVTPDEVPDPYRLEMWATVNGEEWSRGNSSQQDWTFEEIIEHVSRSETLHPGEFLASGTVPTGCGMELGRRLSPGDVVSLNVERIGALTTRFVSDGDYRPFEFLPRSAKRKP